MDNPEQLQKQYLDLQAKYKEMQTYVQQQRYALNSVKQEQKAQQQQQLAKMQNAEVCRVSPKIPQFWPDKAALWFVQVEAQFSIAGITKDFTKFDYVVSQSDPRYIAEIEDILVGSTEKRTYERLKEELYARLTISEERRVQQLLSEEELGDRKPSQFLRHLRSLAGSNATVSDRLLRQLWIQRLPSNVSAILAIQSNQLAVQADKIAEDSANTFFKASQGLFNPSKIIAGSVSESQLLKAKEDIPLLAPIPTSNFKVLHAILAGSVKEITKSNPKSDSDPVVNALLVMKANHPDFVTACLQVLHMPVGSVDCERGFSAYGDILTSERTRLTARNTKIMMCLYFSDDFDMNNNASNVHANVSDLGDSGDAAFDLNPDDQPGI